MMNLVVRKGEKERGAETYITKESRAGSRGEGWDEERMALFWDEESGCVMKRTERGRGICRFYIPMQRK
jgi:hypothetical protein